MILTNPAHTDPYEGDQKTMTAMPPLALAKYLLYDVIRTDIVYLIVSGLWKKLISSKICAHLE